MSLKRSKGEKSDWIVRRKGARVSPVPDNSGRSPQASIPNGLAALAAKGAREIVAFPYFLAAGTHVAQDIPDAIAEFTATHPAVTVRLAPHLGASTVLPAAILNVAA